MGILSLRLLTNKTSLLQITSFGVLLAVLFSIVAPVGIALAEIDEVATNNNANVTSGEVSEALQSVPGILSSSDQVSVSSDADSAAKTNVNGAVVDVPKDAEQGVTFGATTGPKLEIELPNADDASAAKKVAPGVVGYDSGNGSANAVQPTEDGGVRMLTIIDNPDAPTEYDYKVTVPNGGFIELAEDGGAMVFGGEGEVISSVAAPWAKDAIGNKINTYFTTDGQTLTQHVLHNVPGIVYPVTADPAWLAVAAGVIGWALYHCAGGIVSGFGLDAVRWAFQRGNWYWQNKIHDALWNCAWGIAGGGALRWAPSWVKWDTSSKIVSGSKRILRWK